MPPEPSSLSGSPFSRSFQASPIVTCSSPLPSMVSAGSMASPLQAPNLPSSSPPINLPHQIYTNPIISLPPSPVQPYTTNSPHLVYPTLPHKLPSYSTRSVTRHHPYHKQGSAATSKDHPPFEDTYPSPLSELSKTSGQKWMAVSKISDLFPVPFKKIATGSSQEDRMLLAAHSLSSLRESSPAPTTPVLPTTPLVTHSSFAESSPLARVESMGFSTAPMSPTLEKKVYKAAKKSRSDSIDFDGYRFSCSGYYFCTS